MSFKIEKGLPIPRDRRRSSIYPWREMDIGDSFVGGVSARSLASRAGKEIGFKFTSRQIGKNKFRIWRVE